MVWQNKYPICEFDTNKNPMLEELHALEPSREIECHKETVEMVVSCLKQMGIPFKTGKTWTSDAIYRETPDMIALRRNEGCITVEMEAAVFLQCLSIIIFRSRSYYMPVMM